MCFRLPWRWALWSSAGCDLLFGNVNARSRTQATSTARALDQGIWTSLWSHTQVRHKNTWAYICRCVCVCSQRLFWLKKRRAIAVFIKRSTFQESNSALRVPGPQNQTFRGSLHEVSHLDSLLSWWWNESRCPTPRQGTKVLLLYKEAFKNNPQIQTLRSRLCYFAQLDLPTLPWLGFPDSFCMWVHVCSWVLWRINHLLYCTFEVTYLKANAQTPATHYK